jgi:AraC-like DNA-binding protein
MRYIDGNLFMIENLSRIAEHFHHNYSYLSKKFKETTKLTLSEYLADKKLERAKLLIKEDKLSFTEIAELLHYASLYSFSKSFKFHFGVSPREYKNSHQHSSPTE